MGLQISLAGRFHLSSNNKSIRLSYPTRILNQNTHTHTHTHYALRRFGTAKWPFSEKKSYIGSAAFVVGAFVVCAVLLSYLSANGLMIGFDVVKKLPQLLVISILCALVELIPIGMYSSSHLQHEVLSSSLNHHLTCY
jgi:hypothetical protein